VCMCVYVCMCMCVCVCVCVCVQLSRDTVLQLQRELASSLDKVPPAVQRACDVSITAPPIDRVHDMVAAACIASLIPLYVCISARHGGVDVHVCARVDVHAYYVCVCARACVCLCVFVCLCVCVCVCLR
jgi:hypothetical protein